MTSLITTEAHKHMLINDPVVREEIDAERANSMSGDAAVLWGTNALIESSRSQAQLGWFPRAPALRSQIVAIVKNEAASNIPAIVANIYRVGA